MDGGSPAYILLNVLRSLHYYIQLYISYIIFRVSTPLFFADPDPGKNLHADPDPGGIRRRGVGVKGHNDFFFEFFSRFR